jgi:hypothetical protein
VDPIDPLERELDGEGRRGIENNPKGLEGGGVEVIVVVGSMLTVQYLSTRASS